MTSPRFFFAGSAGALLLAMIAGITTRPAHADVSLPALFGSGMVLQRGVPIPVWGKAVPGEKITVSLRNAASAVQTEAGADGKWRVALASLPAGGPFTLTVAGNNKIVLTNVLVGDVWLCSGQSNIELSLRRADHANEVIAASADSGLRFARVHQATPEKPADDVRGPLTWETADPKTAGGWSAVGYFFGHALRKAGSATKSPGADVPIGLIGSYVGGTPGQAWTREAVLTGDPDLERFYIAPFAGEQADHDRQIKEYDAALARAKATGAKEPQKPYGFWHYSGLYNGMIAPLTPFPIRGVVWYQGESNAKNPDGYRVLLPALIRDWRAQWHSPEMPFLMVQLPPFGSPAGNGVAWAEMREIQAQAAQTLPHVGLVVTTDVGTQHNIHPTNKRPVGERLALLARKMVDGENGIEARGPTFRAVRVEGGKALVTFDNTGDGLEARGGESSGQPVAADTLMGFTVAGAEGGFVPATAKIVDKTTVEVFASTVASPKAVRYGFTNFPVVNLWNKNGLPASPFRTDAPVSMATPASALPSLQTPSSAAVLVKRKPDDAAWKPYPVHTSAGLVGLPGSPTLDKWGGRTDRKADATGFFHPRKIGDRWWLVDPDGNLFLHVGVDSVNLGPATTQSAREKAFGTPEQWASQTTDLLRRLGFNGTGAWSDVSLLSKVSTEPMVYTIIGTGGETAGGFMGNFGKQLKVTHAAAGHAAFVNDCLPVFHPDFPAFCDTFAKSCARWKNDPHLLGYFSDNELPTPKLDKYLSLPPDDPAMGSSYQAAQKWFDARKKKKATLAEVTDSDRAAWTEYAYDRYLALTTNALRKYDPNHLCLGPRFYTNKNSPEIWRAAGRYLDVVALNHYGVWDPGTSTNLANYAAWSGKPLIITEFYAKGMDSGFTNTSGAGWVVQTQADRGLFYETFALGLLLSKNCVGWHWFKYQDNDPNDKNADPSNADSNKGIVTNGYTLYAPLTDHMSDLNHRVYAITDFFDKQK